MGASSSQVGALLDTEEAGGAGEGEALDPFGGRDVEMRRLKELARARLFGEVPETLRIGRFRVLDRLGEGGMGVVYSAYDERLDRRVAVKVLRGRHALSAEGQARILKEAQAMARLTHPNVVAVHEVGDHEGEVFIAMEFVRGESLEVWAAGEQDWRAVHGVYLRAGEGLMAAHRAGVVHRDFKPHNVIRGEDGAVKVLDFGLARTSSAESTGPGVARARDGATAGEEERERTNAGGGAEARLTMTGAVLGTPAYMSPEQFAGVPATPLSDQFSFCVALYEALHAQLPFAGETVMSLSAAVLAGEVRTPPASSVPAWIDQVIRRGLAVDPSERYPSMAELLRALRDDPGVRTRRWLAIGGLAATMAIGGYGAAMIGEAAPSCEQSAAAAIELWRPERQDLLATAFAGASRDFGPEAWRTIQPKLDTYVGGLVAFRRDVCQGHRGGEVSDTLYELQDACLDRRQAGLEELLSALEEPTPTMIERSAAAVGGLLALDYCADREALLAEEPPPEDPLVRSGVIDARLGLERARADELLGAADRALERAEAIRTRAEALGYRPLVAEAWLRVGAAHQELRDGPLAAEAMDEAFYAGLRSQRSDIAAEASARQIFITADLLQRPEAALADVELARALSDARPAPWRAWLLANNIGVARWIGEDADGALAEYGRAIEALEPGETWSYERLITGGNIGLALALRGETRAAAVRYESVLADARALMGDQHPTVARIALQLSSCLAESGRLREAEALLALADRSLPAGYGELADWIAWGRARLALDRREYGEARSLLEETLDRRHRREGGPSDLDAPFSALLGVSRAGEGDVEGGSLAVEATSGRMPANEGAQVLILLGRVLMSRGEYERSARALTRALEQSERGSLANISLAAQAGLVGARLAQGEKTVARDVLVAAEARLALHPELAEEVLAAEVALARGDLELAEGSLVAARQAHRQALSLLEGTDADFQPGLRAAFSALRSRSREEGWGRAAEALALRYHAAGPAFARELARLRALQRGPELPAGAAAEDQASGR